MADENKKTNSPLNETAMTPAQKRAAERDARVAAKLRENLRRRKQAARKQKAAAKPED